MTDGGEADEKIIAIPFGEPQMNDWKDIIDIPSHIYKEIQHFFSVYKTLESNKNTVIKEVKGAEEAKKIIKSCMINYAKKYLLNSSISEDVL
jgi:inorganic pyrophosphatase